MFIPPTEVKKFPKLSHFICEKVILLPRKDPDTYEKFIFTAGISSKEMFFSVYSMFLPGFPPIIIFEDLLARFGKTLYGHFQDDIARKHPILLDTKMAQLFEDHPTSLRGQQLVIAKTLHEMVHWAASFFSMRYPKKVPAEGAYELGNLFEKRVYHKVLQMADTEWN